MIQVNFDVTDHQFRKVLREEIRKEMQATMTDIVREEIRTEIETTLAAVVHEEISNTMADVARKAKLPIFLTKVQLMELLHIKDTKASELMSRPDFPVCREAGVLIPTHMLFKWVEKNTRWIEMNSDFYNQAI